MVLIMMFVMVMVVFRNKNEIDDVGMAEESIILSQGEGFNCETNETSGDGSWSNVAAQKDWILDQLVPERRTGVKKTDVDPTLYTKKGIPTLLGNCETYFWSNNKNEHCTRSRLQPR